MAKTIQIRNVPEELHHRLVVRAAEQRESLSELVLGELEEIGARPTMAEMLRRLETRQPVESEESATDAVRAGREERLA